MSSNEVIPITEKENKEDKFITIITTKEEIDQRQPPCLILIIKPINILDFEILKGLQGQPMLTNTITKTLTPEKLQEQADKLGLFFDKLISLFKETSLNHVFVHGNHINLCATRGGFEQFKTKLKEELNPYFQKEKSD